MARALAYLFFAGFAAAIFSVRFYPPVRQNPLWITLGVIFVLGLIALARQSSRVQQRRREQPYPSVVYIVITLLPVLVTAAILANGKFDRAPATPRPSIVVTKSAGKSGYRFWVSASGSVVQTSIPTSRECYQKIRTGQNITVMEKPGLLGVPWISGPAECGAR